MSPRPCWWCGRPASTSFPGQVDDRLVPLHLCLRCWEAAEPSLVHGSVDVLVLQDRLAAAVSRPSGEVLQSIGKLSSPGMAAAGGSHQGGER